MRIRDSIAIAAAALSVAASFVVVNLPLPVQVPSETEGLPRAVVVTETGVWDCPDEADF